MKKGRYQSARKAVEAGCFEKRCSSQPLARRAEQKGRAEERVKQRQCPLLSGLLAGIMMAAIVAAPSPARAIWPFDLLSKAEKIEKGDQEASKTRHAVREEEKKAAMASEAATLHQQVARFATTLLNRLEDPDPDTGDLADGLIVCTFVDLSKLTRTSSFGRYLAEQMMTELQKRRVRVVELRKGVSVVIQERSGEFGLSRDPDETRGEVAAGAMLSGTYQVTPNEVIVNARIYDNRTATILAAESAIFPRGSVVEALLSDARTLKKAASEPVYLKRLAL